jgi:hypothetical protein
MGSWFCGGVVVGMIELHEQAITTIASTKDKTVIRTFLLGFMTFSFVNKLWIDTVIVQYSRGIHPVIFYPIFP